MNAANPQFEFEFCIVIYCECKIIGKGLNQTGNKIEKKTKGNFCSIISKTEVFPLSKLK